MYKFLLLLFLIVCIEKNSLWANREDCSLLSVGAGYLTRSSLSPAYQIEGRSALFCNCLRMQIGFLTERWQSAYTYGGIGYETNILGRLYFYPSFSPGIYFRGKGVDLGSAIEFRSCLDVFYKISDRFHVGGEFFHLSNAHLGHHNPGVNGVIFYLSILCLR